MRGCWPAQSLPSKASAPGPGEGGGDDYRKGSLCAAGAASMEKLRLMWGNKAGVEGVCGCVCTRERAGGKNCLY